MMRMPALPTLLVFFVITVSAALSVAGTNLLENPDFDGPISNGKADGWQMDGKKCVAGYGYGRNSSNGLKYAGDGGPYSWVVQSVPIEVGKLYRFEGWTKTDGIRSARGVRLHLSFFTAKGKWCESTDSNAVTGTTDDWTQMVVEGTPQAGAARAELSIRLDDGETGVAYLDDFSFGKSEKSPIRFLVSDAYRDAATGGTVHFRLVTNLTDSEIGARGITGNVLLPSDGGKRRQSSFALPDFRDGVSTFSVDLDRMPFGKFPVSAALNGSNGVRVATATLIFDHLKKSPACRVSVDSRGRAIVDGKPFFPLGMFMDAMSGEKAEIYAKGPFNCVLPYATLTQRQMDWAASRGLKVIYSLKNLYRGYGFQPYPISDDADETAVVASHVALVKDHPALLAWYIADEMGPGMIPRLKARSHLLRQLDPDHPTYNCICRTDILRDYMETADVLGGDPYPIHADMKPDALAKVANNTHLCRKAFFGERPLWQVTQAFDDSYLSKDPAKIRPPTKAELLNMNLQCVASGANGVLMWAYHHLGQTARGHEHFDIRWKEVCEVGETIRRMIPVFLSDDVSRLVKGRQADLPVRAWRHEGRIWVLAVNAGPVQKKVTIQVDGRPLELDIPPLGWHFEPFGEQVEGASNPVPADKGDPIRFMTFNIFGAGYCGFSSEEREDRAVSVVRKQAPDLISWQEVNAGWWHSKLFTTMDEYEVVRGDEADALARAGVDTAKLRRPFFNHEPLMFRRSRFKLLDSGLDLFHPSLQVEKTLTWAVLEDRTGGKRFIAFATHFWYKESEESDAIRELNVRHVLWRVFAIRAKWGNLPVIGGGDFNCEKDSLAMATFAREGYADAGEVAPVRSTVPSYHGPLERDADGRCRGHVGVIGKKDNNMLDHVVFTAMDFTALRHQVVTDEEAINASDHSPVVVDVRWNDRH